MTNSLLHFLRMGGYGFYIWSAYAFVFIFLFLQWFIPWRRWQRYHKQQKNSKNIIHE